MDEQKQNLTLEESIAQVMRTLPPPIRNYLAQGKYSLVAKNLMATYGLHIDQATVLEREMMLLLMGIITPDEFTRVLAEEGRLDAQTIDGITRDVNEQIFVPLRDEMRKGPPEPPAPRVAPPRPPAAPVPSYQTPAPPPPRPPVARPGQVMPPPPPRPQTPPPAAVEFKPPPPPPQAPPTPAPLQWSPQDAVFIPSNPQLPQRPQEMINKLPRYTPSRPAPPRPRANNAPYRPPEQKSAPARPVDNRHLLPDHEEPHIEFHQPSPRAVEGTAKAPPPPNLPSAMFHPPEARHTGVGGPPTHTPSAPPPPAQPKVQTPPQANSYQADPYREPIDEQ